MLPPIQLDSHSDVPIYRQLFENLKMHIQSGKIAKGGRLPATRELAGLLGLNRATVSSAYELLESEGLLRGHVGRGSFVAGADTHLPGLAWEEVGSNPPLLPSLSLPEEGYSFASSRPAGELFPLDDFRKCCEEVIRGSEAVRILQLGSPAGYGPLRAFVRESAAQEGAARVTDDVAITSGCQQALDLLERVLVQPGDAVVVEDPVYPGLRGVFGGAGSRLIGVPVGVDGLDLDALAHVVDRERPRLLIVTPNFQNPTGTTMPLAARQRLLRMAREASMIVVENDIYGSLRYEGEPIPSLKQLDATGDVVLLGSFSKVAFPGLRVGWVIGPKPLVDRLKQAKQWSDLHSDQLSQAVLFRFAESGRLANHCRRVLTEGRKRLQEAVDACDAFLPAGTKFTRPQGGINLWVRLPEGVDTGEMLPRAERAQVNYLPGKYFAVARAETSALRLSFLGLEPERIRKGISILGELFREECERLRRARAVEPSHALV
ncbi:MAG: PLP-dependent aminotransferase family protein [Candidatus Solibacter usitatus]|nr:PLP-dependent aminotransferase family protein [Candidatus Solibacter usitatus]